MNEPVEAEEGSDDSTIDLVVSEFIDSYNVISQSPVVLAEQGNIRTKCHAESYDHHLELLDANDTGKAHVTIDQMNDSAEAGMAGMRDVCHDVVNTCDPNLTDEEVYAHFDSLIAATLPPRFRLLEQFW